MHGRLLAANLFALIVQVFPPMEIIEPLHNIHLFLTWPCHIICVNKCLTQIDDGYPESSDYENNYVIFEPAEPDGLRKALARRNLTIEDFKIAEPFKPSKCADMKPAKPASVTAINPQSTIHPEKELINFGADVSPI